MNNTQSASATPNRRRRRLTTALLVLGLSVGTIATTATPVEAATWVIACYNRTDQLPITQGLNVQLKAYIDPTPITAGGWVQIGATQQIDSTGCTTFLVPVQHRDKWLYTELSHVMSDGRTYYGWGSQSYFWWSGHWWQMTHFGAAYAPFNGLIWHNNFQDIWASMGTYSCNNNNPAGRPLPPC